MLFETDDCQFSCRIHNDRSLSGFFQLIIINNNVVAIKKGYLLRLGFFQVTCHASYARYIKAGFTLGFSMGRYKQQGCILRMKSFHA